MRPRSTFRPLITLGTALSLFLALGVGTAEASAAQNRADDSTRLTVNVNAQRFDARGGKVVARGPVVVTAQRPDGSTETFTQEVNLKVKPTKNCRILNLHLAKLYLNLLGLQVRTSAINAQVTGESKQALGKLFCKLSDSLTLGKKALARKTADSLNKELGKQGLPVLTLKSAIRPQTQPGVARMDRAGSGGGNVPPVPPGSCEVLDLLLGPLHLNLLGLVVDLYGESPKDPVRVLVTADPNGGQLGASLCQFAGPYTG